MGEGRGERGGLCTREFHPGVKQDTGETMQEDIPGPQLRSHSVALTTRVPCPQEWKATVVHAPLNNTGKREPRTEGDRWPCLLILQVGKKIMRPKWAKVWGN